MFISIDVPLWFNKTDVNWENGFRHASGPVHVQTSHPLHLFPAKNNIFRCKIMFSYTKSKKTFYGNKIFNSFLQNFVGKMLKKHILTSG